MNICILMPAYCPTLEFIGLIKSLNNLDVFVINDGSGAAYDHLFQKIKHVKNYTVIRHALNLGKGRAIKTGLNYILNKYPDIKGVVIADGQHVVEDIKNVAKVLETNSDKLILGCRNFSNDIPLRSKFGNIITKGIFKLMVGIGISDTQTGLRGIPVQFIPTCIQLSGERYEYAINMLIAAAKKKIQIIEEPIKTIYIDDNKSSHFNHILDSFRIYFVLLRFFLSSISTSLIDFIVFYICISTNVELAISTSAARIVAGNFNFFVNSIFIFKRKINLQLSLTIFYGYRIIEVNNVGMR